MNNPTKMDPKWKRIRIIRVQNGWVILPASYSDCELAGPELVAQTPEVLTTLLLDWAARQHESANETP